MNKKPFQKRVSLILSVIAIVMSLLVMIGWWTDTRFLIQLVPRFVPMQFNTALLLFASAFGIFLSQFISRYFALPLALFVFLFAGLSLAQYAFNLNFGIDELFHQAQVTTRTTHAGRMAPNTAIAYLLIGSALFFFDPRKKGSNNWISCCLAVMAISFGFVSLLGYVTDLEDAFGWEKLTDMAAHTSVGFVLLGSALIISLLTFDREGKISKWVISPNIIFAFTTIFLLWRAIEVQRIRAIATNTSLGVNYTIIVVLLFFVLYTIFLQKEAIHITDDLEEAKYESELNNKTKTTILHYVSHELRNPLNAVIGFSEPFADDPEVKGEVKEALDSIFTASIHMKSIIDDLLAVSRFNSGKIRLESHDYKFRPWIQNIGKGLSKRGEKQNIHFTLHFPDSMPDSLKGDSLKLAQIIINLCENAFKYTPQKGEVKLSLWIEDQQNIAPKLKIKIEDNGRGIPEKIQKQIFEPFVQVLGSDVKMGLGLGLSICKKYLDMMGGTVEMQSQEGKGTTFTCTVEAYLNGNS